MWDMLVRIDEIIAQPVLKQMKKELLEEPFLHADETSVTIRLEDQKGSKKGWVWGWRNEPIDPLMISTRCRSSLASVEVATQRVRFWLTGPAR